MMRGNFESAWQIACICLAFFCFCASAHAALPAPVVAELKAAGIPASAVGIVVQQVGKRAALIELNPRQAMNPASAMKLITTWAALEMLGPALTWTTRAYIQGTLADGILYGDLIIQGSGDPRLTQEQFWLLLRQLRARGLRQIKGDLVLDRSAFAPIAQDTAFDDKPLRPYNVAPDALLLNFKAVRLTLIPRGERIVLSAEPPLTDLNIVNLMRTVPGECGEWKDGLRAEQTEHEGRYQLALSGSYPAACSEQDWNLGVLSHRDYAAAVFRDLWRELGGTLDGAVRDGTTPSAAQPMAVIESPPLAEIVRDINKYSNNVMARELFLSLARDKPATLPGAAAAVKQWLADRNIAAPELVLDNGAGLSRHERISAATLAQLLQDAAASPLMPEFVASLPLAAVDGTMKKRLKDDGIAGHAHIKTGTLDGIKTMAGYVLDARGRTMIVVFLVNHPNAQRAQAAEDALLRWVYRR
ncbi:D-alanyl-D-alanine carboxypeptidase [Georgfuchsia toluolica]|uniref:D-alanyl-D-alanine carboxypeptidase n=1 Tax=Georgfuchsia toluolica TaxID=424218 RepID=A0A916J5K8_9PROT|nr:D-alanyl-D-alanine carboxypeptidase/D-alanyl-D-alanine-endopeptidase [Georgfuchsia toluolica]CAG4884639.1 D-alanyl-D-alanine carboxypeptidase [Georgfuchsia toluolica]